MPRLFEGQCLKKVALQPDDPRQWFLDNGKVPPTLAGTPPYCGQ